MGGCLDDSLLRLQLKREPQRKPDRTSNCYPIGRYLPLHQAASFENQSTQLSPSFWLPKLCYVLFCHRCIDDTMAHKLQTYIHFREKVTLPALISYDGYQAPSGWTSR